MKSDFRELLAASAAIGRDPALVQGAGGNTSVKRDGVLWVKASGTWLAEAEARDIMVPVEIAPLLAALDTDEAEQGERFVVAAQNPSGLRPSIETTMHAALPHRVVLHVHCVETLAWVALEGVEAMLRPLLAGLDWRFVPYLRPGAPLTRAILAAGVADVLVLGNHGLVVGADSIAAAWSLLRTVQARLRRPVRPAPPPDLARLSAMAGPGWAPAPDAAHGAGTDAVSARLAVQGSLYPDHVIFLGPGALVLGPDETLPDALARCVVAPPLALVPGAGALLRQDASAGAVALARCLADVLARLGPADILHPLTAAQETELAGWDAEAYRRTLDRPA